MPGRVEFVWQKAHSARSDACFWPLVQVIPYWGNQQQRKILRREWRGKNLGQRESPFHVVITSYQMAVTDEEHFNILNWQYMVRRRASPNSHSQHQSALPMVVCNVGLSKNRRHRWCLCACVRACVLLSGPL